MNRETGNAHFEELDKQFDARGRLSFLRFGQSGVGTTIGRTKPETGIFTLFCCGWLTFAVT